MNIFEGIGIDELKAIRKRLQNRLLSGGIVRLGGPGGGDQFVGKTDTEIRSLLDEVQAAIFLLDPNETNPNDRPGITRVVYGR